ncbi:MAG TPA: hypothetical protein VE618_11610 [Myxococcaceae bacterium]|nr:hypothetical protein [Myxococcaceae bacterium]
MPENHWDDQFKAFLKRAQDDLKRMGQDIRDEAQKLVAQVQDPGTQGKVREGLRELGAWARRTAEDVAGLVEKSADRAENAIRSIRGGPRSGSNGRKRASSKSVGPRKRPAGGAPKKKTGGAARKTVGRRPARR